MIFVIIRNHFKYLNPEKIGLVICYDKNFKCIHRKKKGWVNRDNKNNENSSYYLFSISWVPGTVRGTFNSLTHLILMTTQCVI